MLIGSVNQCRENRCYIITVSSATNATRRTHMREFRPRASHNTTCGHSLWCGRRRMPLEGLTCASSTQGPRIPPPRRERHPKMEHGLFCVCKTSGWAFWNWESPPGCSANTSTFRFWGALFSFSFSDGDLSWFPCLLSHGASRLVPSPFVLSRLVPSPFVLIVLTMPAGGLSQLQKAYDVLQTRNKPNSVFFLLTVGCPLSLNGPGRFDFPTFPAPKSGSESHRETCTVTLNTPIDSEYPLTTALLRLDSGVPTDPFINMHNLTKFSVLVQPHSCRRPMMLSPCYAKIN
jgi:hypothetical protein